MLEPVQTLDTTGARAVETFLHEGTRYLVVPQLARDVPSTPAQMNGGDSDVEAIVLRWQSDRFVEHQRLAVPGGEDAEFFHIGGRAFLATASLRRGAGPYELNVDSLIYELIGNRFEPFQAIPTFAAKQWKHFAIGERHFLALAQGATVPGATARHPAESCIFEWTGRQFERLQTVPSAWGYNWAFFRAGKELLLGYADNVEKSRLFRWTGSRFEGFQDMEGGSGRAFCAFTVGSELLLGFCSLHGDTTIYRWSEDRFVPQQTLSGPGGRELKAFQSAGSDYLVQVNFLLGTREAPQTSLTSRIFVYREGRFTPAAEFPTLGGTDAAVFEVGGSQYLAVSNSLTAEVRFAARTAIYRIVV
jgi:hypothetical protein